MDRGDWFLVVGSVVIGQVALLGIEWLRSFLDRRQRRQDRRDEFQRTTLVDLREALVEIANTAGALYLAVMTGNPPTLELLDEHRQAEARFHVLFYAVANANAREACNQYLGSVHATLDAIIKPEKPDLAGVKKTYDAAGWKMNDALKAINEQLRSF